MCEFICNTMQYPKELKNRKVGGVTAVIFMVHQDGSISDVEVSKTSKHRKLDDEAVRIVNSFPDWVPAEVEGKSVDMKNRLNIVFDPKQCGCGKLLKRK